ncbi:hypothetical protein SUGI_1137370 [Cryptomeria japonica]|nr:hypothetical protein SUGI_1137370 [Cryptomeria japonica]
MLTLQSLKKNANVLGIEEMSDDHFKEMIEATDLNDDRFIDQNEFVMLTLSPSFMTKALKWLENVLIQELKGFV